MSRRSATRSSSAFIAGAVVAVVLGTGTAYAANGGVFRLGRSNSATSATTLTNSNGTALKLNSKAGQPSLQVNRNAKVPSLNSDLLDGIDSASFARVTTVGSIVGTGFVDNGGTSDPADDAVIAVAECPAGSQVVGGGGAELHRRRHPVLQRPGCRRRVARGLVDRRLERDQRGKRRGLRQVLEPPHQRGQQHA